MMEVKYSEENNLKYMTSGLQEEENKKKKQQNGEFTESAEDGEKEKIEYFTE